MKDVVKGILRWLCVALCVFPCIAILAWPFVASMSIFAFDAPGSTGKIMPYIFSLFLLSYPITAVVGLWLAIKAYSNKRTSLSCIALSIGYSHALFFLFPALIL